MGTSILGSRKSIKSNSCCVWEKTMLRVDFGMWCPYALVIASPGSVGLLLLKVLARCASGEELSWLCCIGVSVVVGCSENA